MTFPGREGFFATKTTTPVFAAGATSSEERINLSLIQAAVEDGLRGIHKLVDSLCKQGAKLTPGQISQSAMDTAALVILDFLDKRQEAQLKEAQLKEAELKEARCPNSSFKLEPGAAEAMKLALDKAVTAEISALGEDKTLANGIVALVRRGIDKAISKYLVLDTSEEYSLTESKPAVAPRSIAARAPSNILGVIQGDRIPRGRILVRGSAVKPVVDDSDHIVLSE